MKNVSAAATALVLCNDPVVVSLLTDVLTPFAISLCVCIDSFSAVKLLDLGKFEAIITDLQQAEEAALVLQLLRLSAANRTAVTFAITAELGRSRDLVHIDSTFVLRRPLSAESIGNTFRAAFGMLVRERRRYFRCPVELVATVETAAPAEISCLVLNISEGGLALYSRRISDAAVTSVRFSLPGDEGQFFAETKVCWRSENGLFGLEFISLPRRAELQEWLALKLDESLPENVVQIFRKSGI